MSRPAPTILADTYVGATLKRLQIAPAAGIWAVTYKGAPFTLISMWDDSRFDQLRKYPKTVFTSSGHAENLARKLNNWFKTDQFDIALLTTKETNMGAGPVRVPNRKPPVPNPIPGRP